MKVSIVIPGFNRWDLTHRRLFELYNQITHKPYEIVYSDDASTDPSVLGGLKWWKTSGPMRLRVVLGAKNKGFSHTCNAGIEHAKGDVIVVLSNDVEVYGDFVTSIVDRLSMGEKTLIGNTLYDWDTGWNNLVINGKKTLFPYLGGYMIAATRDTWDDLGGFDAETYKRYDYEDVDLSTMAIRKGYALHAIKSPHLKHLSGQTIMTVDKNREKRTMKNRARFIEKWSRIYAED